MTSTPDLEQAHAKCGEAKVVLTDLNSRPIETKAENKAKRSYRLTEYGRLNNCGLDTPFYSQKLPLYI